MREVALREAWATLQALGARPDARGAVARAGGPQALLRLPADELLAWLATHAGARGCRTPEALAVRVERVRAAVTEFVAGGGRLLGAPSFGELGRIQSVRDPRLVLFGVGPSELLVSRRAVAIVGTRGATPVACERARRLAASLAEAGVVIVSGGARGVDIHAHRGALEVGGTTIEIVGEPVGQRPPHRHGRLREHPDRVLKLIVHGPEVAPGAWLFAQRNRFIAAAADALVVVAGDVDSGARHAAHAADQLGRVLRVFPGDIDDPQARLANQLLAGTRAQPFQGVDELLGALGLTAPRRSPPTPDRAAPESPLLGALASGPLTVDEAADRLGCSTRDVVMLALELEMCGQLSRVGGRLART